MRDTTALGRQAERLAEAYLSARGWVVLERNFFCRMGEIDLIARDSGELVFVEVRSRADSEHGAPAQTVGRAKIRRIVSTARLYVALKRLNCPMRFDVVAVEAGRLEHIQAAFDAG